MLGVIAAVAMLAMVLQGCGSDSNGVDQSLHDQVTMERDDLQDMLDAANKMVESLKTQLAAEEGDDGTLMTQLQAAQADAARLQKMIDDASEMDDAEEMRACMVNRAKGIMNAMMDTSDEAPTVKVTWDDETDAVDIEVTDDYAAGDAPAAITGWTHATRTQTRAMTVGGTDSVYVYTDIGGPEAMKFAKVHLVNAADATMPFTTVGLGGSNEPADNPGMVKLAMSDAFPATDNTTTMFMDGDSADGTYDGVSGDFDCDGEAGCTVMAVENDDGDIGLTFTGDWTFDPGDADDTVMVDDADFLTFGYWLYKPGDAEDTHFFDTFAMGSQAYDNDSTTAGDAISFIGADDAAVTGRATYRGGAAGKQVRDTRTHG